MIKTIKKEVSRFIKKHNIGAVDYASLKNAIANMGFTVIEFNNIYNDRAVETIIHNLGIGELVTQSRGFTYADSRYRLVFINEDLNDEEKTYVLSHELGHIVCGHFTNSPVIGRDVKEEHEANEFTHYLLKQSGFKKHRKVFISLLIILCLIAIILVAGFTLKNKSSYADNFYVTSTGARYHKKECIFVKNKTNIRKLTQEEFESGTYSPCDMCLPDKAN